MISRLMFLPCLIKLVEGLNFSYIPSIMLDVADLKIIMIMILKSASNIEI